MGYVLLVIGHLLGDFYFQSNETARTKLYNVRKLLLHCLIYGIIQGIMVLIGFSIKYVWLILGIIVLSHGLIDYLKIAILQKFENRSDQAKINLILFITDQILHLGVIIILLFTQPMNTEYSYVLQNTAGDINIWEIEKYTWLLTAYLICGKPAAVFVKLLLFTLDSQGRKDYYTASAKKQYNETELYYTVTAEPITDKSAGKQTGYNVKTMENKNIGAVIGILEREIILTLSLLGQFAAIGFVITAKSIARFKQLEDKDFAEKYLIGTLTSAFIAIGCAVLFSGKILHNLL